MDNIILSNSFETISMEDCCDINGGGISSTIIGLAVAAIAAVVVIGGALLLGVPMLFSPSLITTV